MSPLLLACAAPVAPEAFDDLTVFLFEQHPDDEAMAVGVEGLSAWLDATGEIEPDYSVSPLSEEGVDALDELDHNTENLVGLAVVTRSTHSVEDAAWAMVGADLLQVYPDLFLEYEMSFEGDPDCFLARACPRLAGQEDIHSQFVLGIESYARPYNQYLWVAPESATAMVQRNWLQEPPEVTSELIEVGEQYYLNLFLDDSEGGFWRLQVTWMIYTNNALDEDFILTAAGNSMRDNSVALDSFLDENQP